MNGLNMGANTPNGSLKNKIAGFGGAGSIGLAGMYFIFAQITADLPKMKDLQDVETRTTAKLIAAEIRFIEKIKHIEDNLGHSNTSLLLEAIKNGQKLDDYIYYSRHNNYFKGEKFP